MEQIHRVDYLQDWNSITGMFYVEKSFTQLDWLIMDNALGRKGFEMR